MIISHPFAPLPSCTAITYSKPTSRSNHFVPSSTVPLLVPSYAGTRTLLCSVRSRRENLNSKDFDIDIINEDQQLEDDGGGGFSAQGMYAGMEAKDIDIEEEQEDEDDDGSRYLGRGPYTGREEKDFDRDPEFADILGGFVDDPQKAKSRVSNMMFLIFHDFYIK